MKTVLKRFVYAAIASVTVLACSNAGNEQVEPMCKQSSLVSAVELDPSCKNEKKKAVRVSEMHWEETDWDYIGGAISVRTASDPETGETYYIVNDEIKMSSEEYFLFIEEREKKIQEQQKGKRDLDIPCVVGDDAVGWIAWLTEEETAELFEKYGELAFSDYSEQISDAENGSAGTCRK